MYQGHEVACHTVTHPTIERCPMPEVVQEVINDRIALERIMGYPVGGLSYPNGSYSPEIVSMLPHCGIRYSRTVGNSEGFALPEDPCRWMPTCHHNLAPELFEKFKGEVPRLAPMLMYVWGHSYEFDRQNNWELIEGLLEECSKTTDIWFATNMEIYNYVEAFKQLVFSADGSFVHNPTAITLWGILDAKKKTDGGKIIELAPGETVELHL
jgi:peptidoglycan/xylan/chitin deacetylase (PgdA/CDA1 family)